MRFWQNVVAVLWKDILSEIRTKETISTVLIFTVLIIIIFNFTFQMNGELVSIVTPGILWVTFTFAGVISLNRSFVMEKEEGCLEGLKASPISREAIYIGKMLVSIVFMLFVEIIAIPLFQFLFNIQIITMQFVVIVVATTVGFAAIGTLFSALAVNTKAREMILPILFFSFVIPLIICAVKSTALALSGSDWSILMPWLQIIGAFDLIFITGSYLTFNYVIEE